MTEAERQFALAQLDAGQAALLAALQGLSATQAVFKPSPERWSILECLEHVVLAEKGMLYLIRHGDPDEKRQAPGAEADPVVVAVATDRGHKRTAPEVAQPRGRFATLEDARKAFLSARERTLEFVGQCTENLRTCWTVHPVAGEMDCYRCLLVLATHPSRHAAQIVEVQQHPDFPH